MHVGDRSEYLARSERGGDLGVHAQGLHRNSPAKIISNVVQRRAFTEGSAIIKALLLRPVPRFFLDVWLLQEDPARL